MWGGKTKTLAYGGAKSSAPGESAYTAVVAACSAGKAPVAMRVVRCLKLNWDSPTANTHIPDGCQADAQVNAKAMAWPKMR